MACCTRSDRSITIGGMEMSVIGAPDDVEAVLSGFLTCEFATVARDGTPVAWPVVPLYLPERGRFVLTTTIGFAAKAANVRRDPRVSLLFSDPTGSGLSAPPTVLVQGAATVGEHVETAGDDDLLAHWARVNSLQPMSRFFSSTAPARWFMDWYYMRLLIHVTPWRVSWWVDLSAAPGRLELSDVG